MAYTQAQAAQLQEGWGVEFSPLDITPDPTPPAAPTHDIAKIRKAYTRVQAAMTEAKEAGDMQLLGKLRQDYAAIKELLVEARAQEREAEAQERDSLRHENALLREQVALARKTIGALKHEVARLTDENQTLQAPPPTAEYRKAQTMTPNPIRTFSDKELLQEIDATFGPI